ncbi:MAG TPA: ABC transporter substrate-binding protein [Thermoanaerobaculia bacterium]
MRSKLALLFALTLFACARDERAPLSESVVDENKPQDGGTVIRRLESEIASVNPILATSKYDRLVDNYIFTPLLYLDSNLRPIAGLAKSWDISPDGHRYTFHLNEKATFSDGTPVLASDVVWTLAKIEDPNSGAAQLAGDFENLDLSQTKALDPHTVVVAFKESLAAQLVRFNDLNILPEHVYSKGDFKNDYNVKAVGSGPYRLVKADPQKEIVLQRRNDYWGQKPYLQTVVMKVIPDFVTAWNAMKHGDIDETNVTSDVWLMESRRPEMKRRFEFRRFYTLNYNYVAWNERNPLFQDKRVRRALGMCVDVPSIINNLYHGTARAMSGPFTPDEYAYNPAVPVLPYNPLAARELLNNAGWFDTNNDGLLDKGGKPFKFDMYVFAGSVSGSQFGQVFQQELKKVGVDVNVIPLDPAQLLKHVLAGDYQAVYMGWSLDPEPDLYGAFHSSQIPPKGQNFVYYNNPVADQLITQARTELDFDKRKALLQQLHAVLTADQPYTWTIQVSEKWTISRHLHGVKESRGYGLFLWYPGEFDWWIPRDERVHDRSAGK